MKDNTMINSILKRARAVDFACLLKTGKEINTKSLHKKIKYLIDANYFFSRNRTKNIFFELDQLNIFKNEEEMIIFLEEAFKKYLEKEKKYYIKIKKYYKNHNKQKK